MRCQASRSGVLRGPWRETMGPYSLAIRGPSPYDVVQVAFIDIGPSVSERFPRLTGLL